MASTPVECAVSSDDDYQPKFVRKTIARVHLMSAICDVTSPLFPLMSRAPSSLKVRCSCIILPLMTYGPRTRNSAALRAAAQSDSALSSLLMPAHLVCHLCPRDSAASFVEISPGCYVRSYTLICAAAARPSLHIGTSPLR
jgi:hypothetical protein